MTITAKASVALEKARVLEHQKEWKDAWYYYTIASREKSAEGTRGVERMLRKLNDQDIIDSAGIIRDRRIDSAPTEKPKMSASLSIPSEETRTLIEDRSKTQQKPKAQQMVQNITAEKPKTEKSHGDNVNELLKRAQESEAKGNKKEAFQLLRKAADGGSELARAKIGQRYLKLAVRYLGRQAAFEKLEEKITPPRKEDKTDASSGDKLHFRHQRNRIAELNGCGDMAETETSVLHTAKAEGKTWVGNENENNSPQTEFIIQEIVRYVTYWWGNDCLPEMILVDGQKPVTCEFSLQTGHEFCTETIIWQADFVDEPSWRHIFTLIFRKLFSIFRK